VDLDGDGLTGAAERLLGADPLVPDNPLSLPASIQQSPLSGTVTIPLQISPNIDANAAFTLFIDGAEADAMIQKVNGNWRAVWDTTTEENGPHFINIIYSYANPGDGSHDAVTVAATLVAIDNPLSFNPETRDFTDLLVVDANVNVNADSYTIEVYDSDTQAHLTTLSGNISNGQIETSWNLQDGQGNRIANNGLRCDFYLSSAQQGMSPNLLIGPITIIYRFIEHICCRQYFAAAWGFDPYNDDKSSTAMDNAMLMGVVDNLNTLVDLYGDGTDYTLFPWGASGNNNIPYVWAFRWSYSPEQSDKNALMSALSSSANFYWWGHGSAHSGLPGDVIYPGNNTRIFAHELATTLNNINGTQAHHPYNLVILDCCQGYTKSWANAFGMSFNKRGFSDSKSYYQQILNRDPQAFIGWRGITYPPTKADLSNIAYMQECLDLMFTRWQEGYSINDCIQSYVNALEQNQWWRTQKFLLDTWALSGCYDLQAYDR